MKTSYVKFMKPSNYDFEARIKTQKGYQKYMPFTKHYARMCLSRYHVEKLMNKSEDFVNFFNKMHVGDEFFLTMLKARPNYDYFKVYVITFDNWAYVDAEKRKINEKIKELYIQMEQIKRHDADIMNKIKELQAHRDNIAKNPKTYNEILDDDVDEARQSGAFFWRKFPATLKIEMMT